MSIRPRGLPNYVGWRRLVAAMSRGLARVEDFAAIVSGIIVVATMCLVSADVVGRYFLGRPIAGVYETVQRLSLVGIVWLSVAKTHRLGGHVSFSYVRDKFPGRLARLLQAIPVVLSAGGWAIVAVTAANVGIEQFGVVVRTTIVAMPLGVPFLIVAAGAGLLAIRTLVELSNVSPHQFQERSYDV